MVLKDHFRHRLDHFFTTRIKVLESPFVITNIFMSLNRISLATDSIKWNKKILSYIKQFTDKPEKANILLLHSIFHG